MKKIFSLIIAVCLVFSSIYTIAYAKGDAGVATGYLNTVNVKTGEKAAYQGISKNNIIYMLADDIAAIGEYECEASSIEKTMVENVIANNTVISNICSKLNIDKLFENGNFEYLIFSRKDTTTDYITQIYYHDGFAQTMNKSFKIDTIEHGGKTYLNFEKILYLMHAQWWADGPFLYYYPLDNNIFDFIGENFNYMYESSVQHNALLYEGESKLGHSTRIVFSHILNDIDMRIFIPIYGSDMIKQEWYEDAIMQLATTDESFIDDYGRKQINEYLEDSSFHRIETNLSAININFDAIDKIEDISSKMPKEGAIKFSQWNDLSKLDYDQLSAAQNGLDKYSKGFKNSERALKAIKVVTDFNEVNTRSEEWGKDFIKGLDILYTINEDVYGDYGKDIQKVADKLSDEYENPTTSAVKATIYDVIIDNLWSNTPVEYIESIITLSNLIIKSNPDYAKNIENADLMNTVHALINVENVFLNEFVDNYHDYMHFLDIEEGSSSLHVWNLMQIAIDKNPERTVETRTILNMRNALEMFLKASLRNKTYVYHFSYFNNGGSFWTPTAEAKALEEDIYKTYALLSELISTRDYDKMIYVDETYNSMYSDDYGLVRKQLDSSVLKESIIQDEDKTPDAATVLSPESAVDIYMANKNVWMKNSEIVPMQGYGYCLLDLDFDGVLELISSENTGTGRYSYNKFFKINIEKRTVEEIRLETQNLEGGADYYYQSHESKLLKNKSTGAMFYLFQDFVQGGPAEHTTSITETYMKDGKLYENVLFSEYSGPDYDNNTGDIIKKYIFKNDNVSESEYTQKSNDFYAENSDMNLVWKVIDGSEFDKGDDTLKRERLLDAYYSFSYNGFSFEHKEQVGSAESGGADASGIDKNSLIAKYGLSSQKQFVSCENAEAQNYPDDVFGIISMLDVDLNQDKVNELLVVRVAKADDGSKGKLLAEVYNNNNGNLVLGASKPIYDISFSSAANIYLFYSDVLSEYCIISESSSSGSYTGTSSWLAEVYTISESSIELYKKLEQVPTVGIFADFEEEFEKINVPFAKYCTEFDNKNNNTNYMLLCEVEHEIFGDSSSYMTRNHKLKIIDITSDQSDSSEVTETN